MSLNGLLLIDKPSGWTSFDVVAKVRGIVRQKTGIIRPKVGHAGTLDPAATGLLIVLIGDTCKRAAEYSKLDKTYQVEIRLGETSTTDDGEGEITRTGDYKPTNAEISAALELFQGQIEQLPPAFSAIKVDGQRAYKLAREGKTPDLKPRIVTIHSIKNVIYDYPNLAFVTEVSSGTYIRSLARDLGQKLGTGAYLTALIRTKINDFSVENATGINNIKEANIDTYIK